MEGGSILHRCKRPAPQLRGGLEDIAGKTRNIPEGCELLTVARRMGISLG